MFRSLIQIQRTTCPAGALDHAQIFKFQPPLDLPHIAQSHANGARACVRLAADCHRSR
jgi:hypothetical protein